MWIRSQNKKDLIIVNSMKIYPGNEFSDEYSKCRTVFKIISNGCVELGQYATEARALEVLDEIQKCIVSVEEEKANVQFHKAADGCTRNARDFWVYVMPAE